MKNSYLPLLAAVFVGGAVQNIQAGLVFSENFGTLANGTAITASNTAFTYVRSSTGANPILAAVNPSDFTGSALSIGATTTSQTIVGVTNGTYPSFNVGEIAFDLRTPGAFLTSTGTQFAIAVGTGATFSGANTIANAETTFLLVVGQDGQLQTRLGTSSYTSVGAPLTINTNYSFTIYFNSSASSYNYGTGSIAPNTMDIYFGSVLFVDDAAIQGTASASAFRFAATSVTTPQSYKLDNINVTSLQAVPEPAPVALVGIGLGVVLLSVRRKRA